MKSYKTLNIKKIDDKYIIGDNEIKNNEVAIDKSGLLINNNYYSFYDYDEILIETKTSINIFQINKLNGGLLEYLNHLGFKAI